MIPQGEVDQMPPGHFEVRATEPGIISQACLLRGHVVGAVDLGKVLGEDNTTFEFRGTRVGALREIDDGAELPEFMPGALGGLVVTGIIKG